jgi:hypothetical protein
LCAAPVGEVESQLVGFPLGAIRANDGHDRENEAGDNEEEFEAEVVAHDARR